MGWSNGGYIFDSIIDSLIETSLSFDERVDFYKKIIPRFEYLDWDTQMESLHLDTAYEEALKSLYPEWFEDE